MQPVISFLYSLLTGGPHQATRSMILPPDQCRRTPAVYLVLTTNEPVNRGAKSLQLRAPYPAAPAFLSSFASAVWPRFSRIMDIVLTIAPSKNPPARHRRVFSTVLAAPAFAPEGGGEREPGKARIISRLGFPPR